MPLPKLKNLFVSETHLRFCAIDSWISFLALAIVSKKIQNRQWNSLKVVAICRSKWNWGFSVNVGGLWNRTYIGCLTIQSERQPPHTGQRRREIGELYLVGSCRWRASDNDHAHFEKDLCHRFFPSKSSNFLIKIFLQKMRGSGRWRDFPPNNTGPYLLKKW